MDLLSRGMPLYHRLQKTRGKISEVEENRIVVYWEKPIMGKYYMRIPKNSIGEYIFFTADEVGLPLEDLAAMPKYLSCHNEKILETHRLSSIKAEQADVERIITRLISMAREVIPQLPSAHYLEDIFCRHNKGRYCYDDEQEQLFYLLRYFYAYYYEYRELMELISSKNIDLNLVSIGCGACFDALALSYIADRAHKDFTYRGIDIIDWNIRSLVPVMDDTRVQYDNIRLTRNAVELIENASILFFAKSITDIEKAAMDNILEGLKESRFESGNICIAASYAYYSPTSVDGKSDLQSSQYEDIVNVLLDKGYSVTGVKRIERTDGLQHLWTTEKDICKPSNLIHFFRGEIELLCKKHRQRLSHCGLCSENDKNCSGERWYIQPKLNNGPVCCIIKYLTK